MSTSEDLPGRRAAGTPVPDQPRPTADGLGERRSWIDAEHPPAAAPAVPGAGPAGTGPAGTGPAGIGTGGVAGAGRSTPVGARAAQPPRPGAAPVQRAPERSAFLTVSRIEPWSVMKLSFLVSVALAIIVVVAVFVLWQVLEGMGVFGSVSRIVDQVTRGEVSGGIVLEDYIGLRRVMTYTALLTLVNIVLLTALATLAAFLYNACARLVGGLQVTLAEGS